MNLENIKNFGEIISKKENNKTLYLDQLSNSEYWIPSGKLKKYLRDTYEMTPQEYYNLVVYGDINFVMTCPVCGRQVNFNRFNRGYNETCSRSCSDKLRLEDSDAREKWYIKGVEQRKLNAQNPELKKRWSEEMKEENKKRVENGTHNFLKENGGSENSRRVQLERLSNGTHPFCLSPEEKSERSTQSNLKLSSEGRHNFQQHDIRSKGQMGRILKYSELDQVWYLYISEIIDVDEYLKVGVTRYPEIRAENLGKRNLKNLVPICYGDCESIAKLEYEIKIKFCNGVNNQDEYFSKEVEAEVRNFIENKILSSTTIKRVGESSSKQ